MINKAKAIFGARGPGASIANIEGYASPMDEERAQHRPPPEDKVEIQRRIGLRLPADAEAPMAWPAAEARRDAIARALDAARVALADARTELERAHRQYRDAAAESDIAKTAPPRRDGVAALEARVAGLQERVVGIEEKGAAFRPVWLRAAVAHLDEEDAGDTATIATHQAAVATLTEQITALEAARAKEHDAINRAANQKQARQPRCQAFMKELLALRRPA